MSKHPIPAALTFSMLPDGVYLRAADNGEVRIEAHPGHEADLARWSVPDVLAFVASHRAEVWAWLKAPPLGDPPTPDVPDVYKSLGDFIRATFRSFPLGLTTGELVRACADQGVTVSWPQCVDALNDWRPAPVPAAEPEPEPEPAEGPRQMNFGLAPGKPQ